MTKQQKKKMSKKNKVVEEELYEIDDIGKKIDCIIAANWCRWADCQNEAQYESIKEFINYLMPLVVKDIKASKKETAILRRIQNSFGTSRGAAKRIYGIITLLHSVGKKRIPLLSDKKKKVAAKKK